MDEYTTIRHTSSGSGDDVSESTYEAARSMSMRADAVLASVRAAEAAQPAEWQLRLGQIEAENVKMKDRIEHMAVKSRQVNRKLTVYGDVVVEDADVGGGDTAPGPRAGAPPAPAPLWR